MAYHLIQHCHYQLSQKGLNYQWKTIRKMMMSRVRVTMQAKTKMEKHFIIVAQQKQRTDKRKSIGLWGYHPKFSRS